MGGRGDVSQSPPPPTGGAGIPGGGKTKNLLPEEGKVVAVKSYGGGAAQCPYEEGVEAGAASGFGETRCVVSSVNTKLGGSPGGALKVPRVLCGGVLLRAQRCNAGGGAALLFLGG